MKKTNINKYFQANMESWNRKTIEHFKSDFYDVEKFKRTGSSLNHIELEELGDVKGKSILHLQCHFGQDSLSWAGLGADVTGVDFSEESIKKARQLNTELGLNADFICCNIYDIRKHLNKKFDIVFTSYGVIGWLPDLKEWAGLIADFLEPGGIFYMVEFHPFIWIYDFEFNRIEYSYFNTGIPIKETYTGSYADNKSGNEYTDFGWNHSISEILNSLLKQNFEIIYLNEFPYSVYNCFSEMKETEKGKWVIKGLSEKVPHMISVKARKK
jgi:2-polyprenyl-3-methyl-5-hydroxy-6-metoxy-1,4-benzoquinol methylase